MQPQVRQWWQGRGWGPVRRDTPAWTGVRGCGYSAEAPATHTGRPESATLISLSPLLPTRCICWVLIGFRGVSSEDQGEGGGLGRMGEGLPLCCCPQLSTHLRQDGNPAPSHTQHWAPAGIKRPHICLGSHPAAPSPPELEPAHVPCWPLSPRLHIRAALCPACVNILAARETSVGRAAQGCTWSGRVRQPRGSQASGSTPHRPHQEP